VEAAWGINGFVKDCPILVVNNQNDEVKNFNNIYI